MGDVHHLAIALFSQEIAAGTKLCLYSFHLHLWVTAMEYELYNYEVTSPLGNLILRSLFFREPFSRLWQWRKKGGISILRPIRCCFYTLPQFKDYECPKMLTARIPLPAGFVWYFHVLSELSHSPIYVKFIVDSKSRVGENSTVCGCLYFSPVMKLLFKKGWGD